MSLRIRVLLTVLLVLALATLLDLGLLHFIVFRSFSTLEHTAARRALARCTQAITGEVQHLNTFAQDWASWDDTYAYVQHHHRDYEAVNLLPEGFANAQLNLLYIVDATGQVIWGKAYDTDTRSELHLADFPTGAWPATHPLLAIRPQDAPASAAKSLAEQPAETREISGLMVTERGLLLVAALPILTSAGDGPARGTLIMGRFLDRNLLEALRQRVGVDFYTWPIPAADPLRIVPDAVPAELRPVLSQFTAQQPFVIQEPSANLLQIYTPMPGITGETALLLRANMPREITSIGQTMMGFVLVSLLAVGIMVAAVLVIFLRQVITGPLATLTAHALNIGGTGDLSARLALRRNDEVGVLAAEFDGMVAQLAQRTAELSRTNEALKQEIAEREQTAETLVALHETALDLAGQRDVPDLLQAIVGRATSLLEAKGGAVYFYRPDTDDLLLALDYDLGSDYNGAILNRGEGLAGKVLDTGRPLAVADYSHWEGRSAQYESAGFAACVAVPITWGDRLLGVLDVLDDAPRTFSPTDIALLERFTPLAAAALEQTRLLEESVRLNDEIRHYAADLERRVVERTAELSQREAALAETAIRLRAANEQLKELDTLKSRFVANVSHELRTPLANIKTLLYLVEKGKLEKRSYYLQTLNNESDLLQQIIEDLLLLSRLDQGRVQPHLAYENINNVLETLSNDRTTLFASHGLTLTTELTPDPLVVLADPRMLIQIATNLMTNAMHYTRPGGAVTIRTARRLIGEETWITFAISDTGPGITPEDRPHLFERFYRGEAGRQSKAPGTGLGLAICGELVERLGGRITVESEMGRGSTFVVWLPDGRDSMPTAASPVR